MTTEIDIINNALTQLGESTILDLTDATRAARIASRTYAEARDSMLRDYKWSFATKRFSLAASTTAPLWEYDNAFLLPSDFLRLTGLNNSSKLDYRIERIAEGTVLVTNLSAPLQGVYIACIEDANQMDPSFREALAAKLAMEWAEPLTASTTLATKMERRFLLKMANARTVSGQEVTITRQPDSGAWIDARY